MAKTKTDALSLRVTATVKKAAERAASDDHRSMASLVEKVMTEWLTEHGYIPKGPRK